MNWLNRFAIPAFFLLPAAGTPRIVATCGVFNRVVDEPAHIACAMGWLDRVQPTERVGKPELLYYVPAAR